MFRMDSVEINPSVVDIGITSTQSGVAAHTSATADGATCSSKLSSGSSAVTNTVLSNKYPTLECTHTGCGFVCSDRLALRQHLVVKHNITDLGAFLLTCPEEGCNARKKYMRDIRRHVHREHGKAVSESDVWKTIDDEYRAQYCSVLKTEEQVIKAMRKAKQLTGKKNKSIRNIHMKVISEKSSAREKVPDAMPLLEAIFPCSDCPFKAPDVSLLTRHISAVHRRPVEMTIRCAICDDRVFNSKEAFTLHWQMSHSEFNDKPANVAVLHATVPQPADPNATVSSGGGTLQCNLCPFTCDRTAELVQHAVQCHVAADSKSSESVVDGAEVQPTSDGWFECGKCEYRTKRSGKLKGHMRLSHRAAVPVKPVFSLTPIRSVSSVDQTTAQSTDTRCDQCGFVARTQGLLVLHKHKQHNPDGAAVSKEPSLYKCDTCSFESDTKSAVRLHAAVAHVLNTSSTTGVSYVANSEKIVRRRRRKECRIVLGRKVKYPGSAARNKPKKPVYSCAQCDFVGTNKTSINYHRYRCHRRPRRGKMAAAAGEKFKCSQCNYATDRPVVFLRHRNRCHNGGVKPVHQDQSVDAHHVFTTASVSALSTDEIIEFPIVSAVNIPSVVMHEISPGKTPKTPAMVANINGAMVIARNDSLNSSAQRAQPCETGNFVEPELPLKCDLCSFRCRKKTSLKMHIDRRHGGIRKPLKRVPMVQKRHQCDRCDYSSGTLSQLRRHRANIHYCGGGKKPAPEPGKLMFYCDLCGYANESGRKIGWHKEFHHWKTFAKLPADLIAAADELPVSILRVMSAEYSLKVSKYFQSYVREVRTVFRSLCSMVRNNDVQNFCLGEEIVDSVIEESSMTTQQIPDSSAEKCALCLKTLSADQTMFNHLFEWHRENSAVNLCGLCPFGTFQVQHLKRHIAEVHSTKNCDSGVPRGVLRVDEVNDGVIRPLAVLVQLME